MFLREFLVVLALLGCAVLDPSGALAAQKVLGDALSGNGAVARTANGFDQLMGEEQPAQLVAEGNFALPANAAQPREAFEGVLTLFPAPPGHFRVLEDVFKLAQGDQRTAALGQLPPMRLQLVQDGSHLIPAQQGLVYTDSAYWNFIVGPGRAWSEKGDRGYTRAALPFALVERNQNCVHNGSLSFLFKAGAKPNVSRVAYQITGEGCPPFQFDMAGQVAARYEPGPVAEADAIEDAHAAEVAGRLPIKPIEALADDYPQTGIRPSILPGPYRQPDKLTTFGVVFRGIHYNSGCATRHTGAGLGRYPFCSEMRLPSYSTAKSAFSSLALMRLGQLYGPSIYRARVLDYVPETALGGDWSAVSFDAVNDMATGNYLSPGYEEDENSEAGDAFLDAEALPDKLKKAIVPFPHCAAPGTVFVYQSAASFIQTRALDAFLKSRQGPQADLFRMMSADVYRPLGMSRGFESTLRTGNTADGAAFGYAGLFWNIDDVAKLAQFIQAGTGSIGGHPVLDAERLQQALFRTPNPGLPVPDPGESAHLHTWVYLHNFWGKRVTRNEFPEIDCEFTAPLMSGYGGITILLLPNGAVFYAFDDGYEFPLARAISELGKLAPYCTK
jgi:hypothetical protein